MKRDKHTRTNLYEVIPLRTPIVMHIEASSACNLKCRFCMYNSGLLEERISKMNMDFEIFKKIIDDCKNFDGIVKRLNLHHSGEPLINPHISEMVRYAKKSKKFKEVGFFTNGLAMTRDKAKEIIDAGIDFIQFSIEGMSDVAYKKNTGVDVNFDALVNNISEFYKYAKSVKSNCYIEAKILDIGLTDKDKLLFEEVFSNISDCINIEKLMDLVPSNLMDTTMGYGGNYRQDGELMREKKVCPSPFYVCTILANGNVDICSCDWMFSGIMGDVKQDSIVDIWNGSKFNEIRLKMLSFERDDIKECKGCKSIGNMLDDLDEVADELLIRFKDSRS